MTEVLIGMKLSRAKTLAEEILAIPANGNLNISLYCDNNDGPGEIVVNLVNDDMERDEVAADEMYAEIEQD